MWLHPGLPHADNDIVGCAVAWSGACDRPTRAASPPTWLHRADQCLNVLARLAADVRHAQDVGRATPVRRHNRRHIAQLLPQLWGHACRCQLQAKGRQRHQAGREWHGLFFKRTSCAGGRRGSKKHISPPFPAASSVPLPHWAAPQRPWRLQAAAVGGALAGVSARRMAAAC